MFELGSEPNFLKLVEEIRQVLKESGGLLLLQRIMKSDKRLYTFNVHLVIRS